MARTSGERGAPFPEGAAFQVTLLTRDRRPLLEGPGAEALLAELQRRRLIREMALHAYVILADRAHLILGTIPGHPLDRLIERIKRATGVRILASGGTQEGTRLGLWEPGFYQHLVPASALSEAIADLHQEPVRRSVARRAGDHPYSSAHLNGERALPGEQLPQGAGVSPGGLEESGPAGSSKHARDRSGVDP